MILPDKTIILSTNDLMNYLEEKLGADIIEALTQFYDFTISESYQDLKDELDALENCLDERDIEISALQQQLYELEKELKNAKN